MVDQAHHVASMVQHADDPNVAGCLLVEHGIGERSDDLKTKAGNIEHFRKGRGPDARRPTDRQHCSIDCGKKPLDYPRRVQNVVVNCIEQIVLGPQLNAEWLHAGWPVARSFIRFRKASS